MTNLDAPYSLAPRPFLSARACVVSVALRVLETI